MKHDEREYGYIEGYAAALWDMRMNIEKGFDGHSKQYDPATIWEGKIHSYIFNLKDGGRHHPLSDYKDVHEVTKYMLVETLECLLPESDEESFVNPETVIQAKRWREYQ